MLVVSAYTAGGHVVYIAGMIGCKICLISYIVIYLFALVILPIGSERKNQLPERFQPNTIRCQTAKALYSR
jgi:hypothetical protein